MTTKKKSAPKAPDKKKAPALPPAKDEPSKKDEAAKDTTQDTAQDQAQPTKEDAAPLKTNFNTPETESRDVQVELESAELLTIVDDAGKLNGEIKKIKAEFAEQKEIVKNRIKTKLDLLNELLKKMETKKELRNVECTKRLNVEDGIVEYIYRGKVVDSRMAKDEDRQGRFL